MLRSIAELVVYGTFAVLLTAASLAPQEGRTASSAPTTTGSQSTLTSFTPANANPAAQPASAITSRGALLFATKGCTGCHTHASFPTARLGSQARRC